MKGFVLSLESGTAKESQRPYKFHQVEVEQPAPYRNQILRYFVNADSEPLKAHSFYEFDIYVKRGPTGFIPVLANARPVADVKVESKAK